jgi:hypothetical protein
MPTMLKYEVRKARKTHDCNYCGCSILPGEKYGYSAHVYDGEFYDWKEHLTCNFIVGELWQYIDPDEGMTQEDFREGCSAFCFDFVCKNCENYEPEENECKEENYYCLGKIYDLLQTHVLSKKKPYGWELKERKREDGE